VLRATFRSTDVIARIGGDEFAVLTVGRDAQSVEVLASRIQEAVHHHNLNHDPQLALSIGVAVACRGESAVNALHFADVEMYSMKRAHHASG
jgi:diguanylate cyclase (GGDEF)-like protein